MANILIPVYCIGLKRPVLVNPVFLCCKIAVEHHIFEDNAMIATRHVKHGWYGPIGLIG